MKYLKSYTNLFENHQSIHDICKEYDITNYTINDDLSIDVNGVVNLYKRSLMKLPLKFRNVSGDFYCDSNQLVSLEGAPQSVGGDFDCANNPIFEIWELFEFEDYSKIELFNDYDALREIDGKPHVVLDRLNAFLQDIGKDPVKKVDGWINI